MSYSSSLGRWLENDPIGYVDGPDMYEMQKSNPIRYVDPLGTRVQVIEALPGNGEATTQPTTRPATPYVARYKARLVNWIDTFTKLPDSKYLEIQKAGQVKWDGQAFNGTKAEFLERMKREATSEVIEFGNGNLKEFENTLSALAKDNSQKWDDTMVAIHGVYDINTGKPLDLVDVNGDQEDQTKALNEIGQILQQAKGDKGIASCFSNAQHLEETIEVAGPYGLDQRANDPDAAKCSVSFFPMKLKTVLVSGPSTRTTQQ